MFHLSTSREQNPKDVFVSNILGEKIYESLNTNRQEIEIDLSKNAKGVYLVKVISDGKVSVRRVVFM